MQSILPEHSILSRVLTAKREGGPFSIGLIFVFNERRNRPYPGLTGGGGGGGGR